MVQFVSAKCPECGASLSIEEGHNQCFCQYCGTKIMFDDGTQTYVYRSVDEARIKEAEAASAVRLKELEFEENKRLAAEKTKALKFRVSIILAITGSLFMLASFFVKGAIGESNSDPEFILFFLGYFAFLAIVFVWVFGGDKDKQ